MTALAEKFHPSVKATAPQYLRHWDATESRPQETTGRSAAVCQSQQAYAAFWWDQMQGSNCQGTLIFPTIALATGGLGETWAFPKSIDCSVHRFVGSPPSPPPIVTFAMQLMVELGRLEDGWDGPGSTAPRDEITKSLLAVTQALPPNTVEPEAEVDSSDGSIALRWFSRDNTSTLSVRLIDQNIICTFSQISGKPQGAMFSRDQVTLMARFLSSFDQMLKNG